VPLIKAIHLHIKDQVQDPVVLHLQEEQVHLKTDSLNKGFQTCSNNSSNRYQCNKIIHLWCLSKSKQIPLKPKHKLPVNKLLCHLSHTRWNTLKVIKVEKRIKRHKVMISSPLILQNQVQLINLLVQVGKHKAIRLPINSIKLQLVMQISNMQKS